MNDLQTIQASEVATTPAFSVTAVMMDPAKLNAVMKFAEMMAGGSVTVPQHLKGEPADCFAITLQAMRWGMDPFVVAGKTSLINGNLCYEAQLVVAVLKSSGAIRGRPHYEWRGEGGSLECRAGFIPAGEDSIVWTEWLSISQIKVQNSPLWKVNPKQQFGYLQGRNWSRLYAPDAMLGVYTPDDFQVLPAQAGAPRDLPPVDEVKPQTTPTQAQALEAYPQDRFEKNLAEWRGVVQSGRKTAEGLITMLSSKASLTDAQKQAIRAFENFDDAQDGAAEEATTDATQD